VQRLLAVLTAGEGVGEAGTAFAEGSAAMAETARGVVTDDFELLFHDAATFKRSPSEHGELVLGLLEQGRLLVLDDLTPDRSGADAIATGLSAIHSSRPRRC